MNFNTPVEIDTELARLYDEQARARATHDRIGDALNNAEIRTVYYTVDDFLEAEKKLLAIITEVLALEAKYTGWQRYWHVANSNGHIHRNQSCTSCFPDTLYYWRTDLSGLTDVEVVEREAYNACSVCMPIAPAEQQEARKNYTRQQREAKAAEKAAIKADKDVKKAERAAKHVDKVEAVISHLGGVNDFIADFALHSNDGSGRRSFYEYRYVDENKVAQMVGDTCEYVLEVGQGGKPASYDTPNEFVLAELKKRGLI